jgi:hypothetical protein
MSLQGDRQIKIPLLDGRVPVTADSTIEFRGMGSFNQITARVETAGPGGSITVNPTGDDNNVVFTTANAAGDVTVAYTAPADDDAAHPFSVDVTGSDIVFNLQVDTDGSTILTTAQDIIDSVMDPESADYSEDAAALVTAANAASNDGTGVVTAISEAPLAAGTLDVKLQYRINGTWVDVTGAGFTQLTAAGGETKVVIRTNAVTWTDDMRAVIDVGSLAAGESFNGVELEVFGAII